MQFNQKSTFVLIQRLALIEWAFCNKADSQWCKENDPVIAGRAVDFGVARRNANASYASASSVSINGFKPARAVIAQLSISGNSLAK